MYHRSFYTVEGFESVLRKGPARNATVGERPTNAEDATLLGRYPNGAATKDAG